MSTIFRKFNDVVWPAPGEELNQLSERLIHDDAPSKHDAMLAASVISAYMILIETSRDNRQAIVAELRQGPNLGG